MGLCHFCHEDIKLKDGETKCPSCGKDPYHCWSCSELIDIKYPECPVCGYFVCNHCGKCGGKCEKNDFINKFLSLNNISEQVKLLDDFIRELKRTKRKICPNNKVFSSYAKDHNKKMVCLLQGLGVKNEKDKLAFINRMKILENKEIGETWIIDDVKNDGTLGQEERITSNLMVCMGLVEIIMKQKNKKCINCGKKFSNLNLKHCKKCNGELDTGDTYSVYKRIDGEEACEHFQWHIIQFKCKNIDKHIEDDTYKSIFNYDELISNFDGSEKELCPICHSKTKIIKTKSNTCNLPIKFFNILEKKKIGDKSDNYRTFKQSMEKNIKSTGTKKPESDRPTDKEIREKGLFAF